MQTKTVNTNDLRDQLQAATKRQQELGHEARTIDADIQEAMKRVAREKAQAARQGKEAAHVSAELDVTSLKERKSALPFEVWAQNLLVAELARDLHQQELEEATVESQKAGEEFATAQREASEAERLRDAAYAASSSAGQRVFNLRGQLRQDARTLQHLEESAPNA